MNTSIQNDSSRFISILNQCNKDYPLFEKKINNLILKNSRLKVYIYILISVIFILGLVIIYLLRSFLF
jgi:hypothetical protein